MYKYFGSTDILMYDIFTIYISSIALLIYNLMHIREKTELLSSVSQTFLKRKSVCDSQKIRFLSIGFAFIEIVLISLYQHGLVSPLNKIVGRLLATGTNYFGLIFVMPLLLPLLCWIIGVDPFKQIDLITPAYPIALFFMKIGCFCAGCCSGITCTWGMYYAVRGCVEAPVQLIEALFSILLFGILKFQKRKSTPGTLFPQYIILYSGSRFFSEFLRSEPNIFIGLKKYQILCIIGFFWGIAQLMFIRQHKNLLLKIFDNNLPSIIIKKKEQSIFERADD